MGTFIFGAISGITAFIIIKGGHLPVVVETIKKGIEKGKDYVKKV